jgi:phage terminase large subunit GpA-like protein
MSIRDIIATWTAWRPAPRLMLSAWAEQNIILPEAQSARPGRFRNWPYMSEILDSIGDPLCERVTVIKPIRVGYTKALVAAIAGSAANQPCPIILLAPTDNDCRDMMIDEIQPVFESSPSISDLVAPPRNDGRSNLQRMTFRRGGNLKILSARSPRNMRRHDAKILLIDEADAMDVTDEGDALVLAEGRTFAHEDRKIVVGSTPTLEGVSAVDSRYHDSDQRVYEVPCPHCGERFEILFSERRRTIAAGEALVAADRGPKGYIEWPPGKPDEAYCVCPNGCVIEEDLKPRMVAAGAWRATRPEVRGHRGYRMNAFMSLLAQAAWGKLAEEWLKAKRSGTATQQVFVNQIEGRVWTTSTTALSADSLSERVEPFSMTDIPEWVLGLTCGVDVQNNWLEATILGWPMPRRELRLDDRRAAFGSPAVLMHHNIQGSTLEPSTWQALDAFLRRQWKHPNGWLMKIDGAAIDSGGGEGRTQQVYSFCQSRMGRGIFAIKGVPGARQVWERGAKSKGGYVHFNVAVDVLKTTVMDGLSASLWVKEGEGPDAPLIINPLAIRLSDELTPEWFDGATNERRRIKYDVNNRPKIVFAPIAPGKPTEKLDCLVYGFAVRHAPEVMNIPWRERAARRQTISTGPKSAADWSAVFNS